MDGTVQSKPPAPLGRGCGWRQAVASPSGQTEHVAFRREQSRLVDFFRLTERPKRRLGPLDEQADMSHYWPSGQVAAVRPRGKRKNRIPCPPKSEAKGHFRFMTQGRRRNVAISDFTVKLDRRGALSPRARPRSPGGCPLMVVVHAPMTEAGRSAILGVLAARWGKSRGQPKRSCDLLDDYDKSPAVSSTMADPEAT